VIIPLFGAAIRGEQIPNNRGISVISNCLPKVFVLDVDGVMTTGQFFYTSEGKVMKVFGADDNDGLSLLKKHLEIRFITGDKKGFPISKKRIVDDMGFDLDIVSTIRRVDWIAERYRLEEVVYMGDGIFDHYVMQKVGYSIAPANADRNAKDYASFITKRAGGDRAVAEAALHILDRFFTSYNPDLPPGNQLTLSGGWSV
jgi:3-deoxy-D-manno-octulosonate 8-phosphate phosphatase (KDO 8-P phosphatase)